MEYQCKTMHVAMCSPLLLLLIAAQHSRVVLHCTLSVQLPDTTDSTRISILVSVPYGIL